MAKAVACALRDAGFADGLIVARNETTGQALARQYGFRGQLLRRRRATKVASANLIFVQRLIDPIVPIPMIPSFTYSIDLALNPPAHRSLEEITLETQEDHQDWNQRQSRVREQCAPLNGVGPY
jgi:hypothetical protein